MLDLDTLSDAQLAKLAEQAANELVQREHNSERIRKSEWLTNNCVRIVCTECKGAGVVWTGGRDIISDPPWEEDCGNCHGEGWRWMVEWKGPQEYDFPDEVAVMEMTF